MNPASEESRYKPLPHRRIACDSIEIRSLALAYMEVLRTAIKPFADHRVLEYNCRVGGQTEKHYVKLLCYGGM
jgi:hypothetical protein